MVYVNDVNRTTPRTIVNKKNSVYNSVEHMVGQNKKCFNYTDNHLTNMN